MAALLHILSGSSPGQSETGTPKWLATSIASLLSAQLMRDEGVVGLMQLIVGEQDEGAHHRLD